MSEAQSLLCVAVIQKKESNFTSTSFYPSKCRHIDRCSHMQSLPFEDISHTETPSLLAVGICNDT